MNRHWKAVLGLLLLMIAAFVAFAVLESYLISFAVVVVGGYGLFMMSASWLRDSRSAPKAPSDQGRHNNNDVTG